jgi:hypothetical protein
VTRQDFEKAAVNVFTEEVAFSIFRRQFIGMSNLQDSKHLMLQILNLHSCCATCQHWHLCQYKMYYLVIVHFNYFWNFAFFLAKQPQGVLLDHVPPFKPCANAFFFSLVVFQGRVKVAPSLSITKG